MSVADKPLVDALHEALLATRPRWLWTRKKRFKVEMKAHYIAVEIERLIHERAS